MSNIRKIITNETVISGAEAYEGETIEQKIERIVNNNEPITDGAPPIYTERDAGVIPAYNIRTDRWDVALDGMDLIERSKAAKREEKAKQKEGSDAGGESIQATE